MGQSKVDYLRKVSLRAERSVLLRGHEPLVVHHCRREGAQWQSFDQQSNALNSLLSQRDTTCTIQPQTAHSKINYVSGREHFNSLPVEGARISYTTPTKTSYRFSYSYLVTP